MKKILNEGNQIHNVISSSGSGSDFLTSYGSDSGSTSQKVTVPFRFRFRFYNTLVFASRLSFLGYSAAFMKKGWVFQKEWTLNGNSYYKKE